MEGQHQEPSPRPPASRCGSTRRAGRTSGRRRRSPPMSAPGPDIVMSWFDDPHQYPDKLVDVTDLADDLGERIRRLVRRAEGLRQERRQVHRPAARRHRQRHLLPRQPREGGGLRRISRRTPPASSKLCKALQGQGHAGRLRARQGGRRRQQLRPLAALEPRRQDGRRGRHGRHQQPRDPRGARIRARSSTQTFIPGTESWLDINNNRAFLAGADLASPPTASRSTTRPRTTRRWRRSPRTSAPPTCRSARSASRSSCTRPPRSDLQPHASTRMRRWPICGSCTTSRR